MLEIKRISWREYCSFRKERAKYTPDFCYENSSILYQNLGTDVPDILIDDHYVATKVNHKKTSLLAVYDLQLYLKNKQKYLYISDLIVHEKYRRQKIGTEILNQIISKFSKDMPIKLSVGIDNIAAINCYKKVGFQVTHVNRQDGVYDLTYKSNSKNI